MRLKVLTTEHVNSIEVYQHGEQKPKDGDYFVIEPNVITKIVLYCNGSLYSFDDIFDDVEETEWGCDV